MMGHSADRANLWLLYVHYIYTLLRRWAMMDILVSCLLSTKIGIIIAQGVQNLAESFVKSLARLVHTRSLLVVVLLRVLLLRMSIVLLDDMR